MTFGSKREDPVPRSSCTSSPISVSSCSVAYTVRRLARVDGRLVAGVRARAETDREGRDVWEIGRLMVAPDLQGRGLGRVLLEHAERQAPAHVAAYRLFTGERSTANLRMYRRAGYRPSGEPAPDGAVVLRKPRRRRPPVS